MLFLVVYILGCSNGFAKCPVNNPRDQPVFWAFEQYVADNYRPKQGLPQDGKREFELAYGHALGRLALAVGDDPVRRDAFKCVALGVDQLANLRFGVDGASAWDGVGQAARGMDDDAVNAKFGVTDISPLEIVFSIAERMAAGEAAEAEPDGTGDTAGEEPATPASSELPKVSAALLNGQAAPDFSCVSGAPAQGQSAGADPGTLGSWKYNYAEKDSDQYKQGGDVVNLCGHGVIEAHSSGTTYIGDYDGKQFVGVWFGNPSCSMSYSGYRCETAPYGNSCWGEIVWRVLDQVPEAYGDKKPGQVARGHWNYCGKQGDQGKGGNWWYGDYYLYAVQQFTK